MADQEGSPSGSLSKSDMVKTAIDIGVVAAASAAAYITGTLIPSLTPETNGGKLLALTVAAAALKFVVTFLMDTRPKSEK